MRILLTIMTRNLEGPSRPLFRRAETPAQRLFTMPAIGMNVEIDRHMLRGGIPARKCIMVANNDHANEK